MAEENISKAWRKMERRVKEITGADMVEARMSERGHITFEVTFTNRSEEQEMANILDAFR